MTLSSRARLLDLVRTRAFSFGNFALVSGKRSTYYVNSKKILFHSESISLLGEAFYEHFLDLDVQAVGGLEIGAIPLATACVMYAHQQGKSLEGFVVRKQTKDHGSKERIEGVLPPGARVAIVDDVLTTGGSALQAFEEVTRAGAQVVAVLCIVDRLEGARELFASRCAYRPLFTIRDFGIEPQR